MSRTARLLVACAAVVLLALAWRAWRGAGEAGDGAIGAIDDDPDGRRTWTASADVEAVIAGDGAPVFVELQASPEMIAYRRNVTATTTYAVSLHKFNPGWGDVRVPKPSLAPVPDSEPPQPLPDAAACAACVGLAANTSGWAASAAPLCTGAVTKVVFFKTHKTASTTMSSLLFRFGVRHGLRFFVPALHYIWFAFERWARPADISMYHHFTFPGGHNFVEIMGWYRARVPGARFITIVRDPVKRLLSEWYYLHQPAYATSSAVAMLHANVTRPKWRTLATDLGLYTDADMQQYLAGGHQQFALILVVERFDESLVLLKRMFGWSFEDILYLPLLDACTEQRRWDGKRVLCGAKIEHTPEELAELRELVKHDYTIYDLAAAELQRHLDGQPREFWDELAYFRQLQAELVALCPREPLNPAPTHAKRPRPLGKTEPSATPEGTRPLTPEGARPLTPEGTRPPVHPRCPPYLLNDVMLERIVRRLGGDVPVSFVDDVAQTLYERRRG